MKPASTIPNARFWLSLGCDHWVKVTVADGDSFDYTTGGAHDEGWWSLTIEVSYDDGIVTLQSHHDGRDCDGRLSSYEISQCELAELRTVPAYGDPSMLLPAWEHGKSSQRDYSAEAAGY